MADQPPPLPFPPLAPFYYSSMYLWASRVGSVCLSVMLWLALSVLYLPGLERYVCCMYNMRKKAERTIIIACQFLGSNTYRFIYILEL